MIAAIFNFLSAAERILLLGGVLLVVIGAIAPTKIYSVELSWPKRRAPIAIVLGLFLMLLGMPQIQQLLLPNINVVKLKSIRAKIDEANTFSHHGSLPQTTNCRTDALTSHLAARDAVIQLDDMLNSKIPGNP